MFGIGLLCLAAFIPSLYGMEARNCGFNDRVLEVKKSNGTVRSGWTHNWSFDWRPYKVNEVITVPYRYVTQYQEGTPDGELERDNPSRNIRNAVKSAFRYVEEHVGCLKFEERNSDEKSLLVHINSTERCGWSTPGGHVHNQLRKRPWNIYLELYASPCSEGLYKDSIEFIDKPKKVCSLWSWGGRFCLWQRDWYSKWFDTFVHEVFHVFGIEHTMKRTDRDNYIKMHDENIPRKWKSQYTSDARIPTPGGRQIPYECNSIMHYEPFDGHFEAVDPSTCKFGSKGPTSNDWKSLEYKVCQLKGFSG